MQLKFRLFIFALSLALLISSCTRSQSPLPFGKATLTPTASATPAPTPTPTATPTPPPTPTPIPAVRIAAGDHALLNGDPEKALQEYQTALDFSSDAQIRAAALLGLGRAYLAVHNNYQAITSLERLIKEYPHATQAAHASFFLAQAHDALKQYSQAAESYLNYLILRPGLVDAYVLDRRGDALFAAGNYAEAANDFQAALQSPSTLDGTLLQLKLARAYAVSGDYGTALTLYDDLYFRSNNDYTKALIDLRKGQAYTALGQTDQAQAAYLDAVQNFPMAYESYSALVALVDAGVSVDELNRGIVDYYAGEFGAASAAFNRYLQANPTDPGTALYYYGLAQRAQGGNKDAILLWDKLISNYPDHRYWDEAWEQKAYTQWAYLEDYDQALKTLLDFVEKAAPSHPRAAEFLFDAASVAERGKKLEQAAELWERVANLYPNYEQAPRAVFLTGVTRYRLGKYPEAQTAFQRYSGMVTAIGDRAAGSFWVGKCQDALGDKEAAHTTWETTANIDPTGYYSERARDILRDRQPFTPPEGFDLAVDWPTERARAEDWLRQRFSLPADLDLSGPGELTSNTGLIRGRELWDLGLYDEARAEFEALRQQVAADPAQSFRLSNYLFDLGAYRSSIMSARQVLSLALMDDAMSLSAPAYFNHLRFGTYYADLIMPLAEQYAFHPLFLLSVVRQESLFEGFVSSSADARGLMQIIPATGADIAKNLGWPPDYSADDLYRPLVSLTFGVDYLDTQRKVFDGDLYAALAAYNGGPGNAHEWKELAPNDPDVFLEVIRYEETRKYIRGIYEIFTLYRVIYNRTS
jgi:soluble lytic murein transglycosylase